MGRSSKQAWSGRGAGSLGRAAAAALSLFALAGAALAPGQAAADPAAGVSQERLDQSRRLMEEGQGLYSQRKYAEAALAFQKAYAAQPFAAFLFNEGVCHEKLGDLARAVEVFRRYVAADPNAPDAEAVRARIKRLEAERDQRRPDGGGAPDGGAPSAEKGPQEAIRSLLLVESEPVGAPVQVWERFEPAALPFRDSAENRGWRQVSDGASPLAVTLPPGRFHVVVPKWRTYNRSESDLEVLSGHVHHFKANLSQGDFMAFLRVSAPVEHALIYLDDPPPHARTPWGEAPHGELLPRGEHALWVEAPGYVTFQATLRLEEGQQKEVVATLERVSYGFLLIDGNASRIQVSIDGQPEGVALGDEPLQIKKSRGRHRLRAEAEGKKPYEADVEVPAGQSREVHVVFLDHYSRGTAWVTATGAALFFGGGAALGVSSNGVYDAMKRDRAAGVLAPDDARGDKGKLLAYGADGCFALGAVMAALATYEFLRDPFPPSGANLDDPKDSEAPRRRGSFAPALAPRLSFAPSLAVSPGGGRGSLTLSGSF